MNHVIEPVFPNSIAHTFIAMVLATLETGRNLHLKVSYNRYDKFILDKELMY